MQQRNSATKPISVSLTLRSRYSNHNVIVQSVFLVGGFGASYWLYDQLKNSFERHGLRFCRPDSHVCV
jgi:hypothetical protein